LGIIRLRYAVEKRIHRNWMDLQLTNLRFTIELYNFRKKDVGEFWGGGFGFYVALSGRRVIYVIIYPRRCPFGTLPLGWVIPGFQPKDLQGNIGAKFNKQF